MADGQNVWERAKLIQVQEREGYSGVISAGETLQALAAEH